MEEAEVFFGRLHDFSIFSRNDNNLVWLETKNGGFSIKSFYTSLASRRVESFPHSIVWNFWAPVRASFFAWEATWVKILTQDQIKKRGRRMPSRCYLCKAEEEMGDHVLHCPKVHILWQLIFALFDVQWVMHFSVREMLLIWGDSFIGQKRKKGLKRGSFMPFLVHLEGEK